MPRRWEVILLIAIDAIAVSVAYLFYYGVRFHWGWLDEAPVRPAWLWLPMVVTSGFWLVLFTLFRLYGRARMGRFWREGVQIVRAAVVGILFLFFVFFINTLEPGSAQVTILVYGGCLVAFVGLGRLGVRNLQRMLLRAGVGAQNLLVVGWADKVDLIVDEIRRNRSLGYAAVAVVRFLAPADDREEAVQAEISILRNTNATTTAEGRLFSASAADLVRSLPALIDQYGIKGMLILLGPGEIHFYLELIRICSSKAIPAKFVSNYYPIAGQLPEESVIRGLYLPQNAGA